MEVDLGSEGRFEIYIDLLARAVEYADRREPMRAYCQGLVLPGDRKSVEPMASRIDPGHLSSRHQSMHHFVADSGWSDEAVLRVARAWALEAMDTQGPLEAWIIDDTGFPKKGSSSVGVAHQYCGVLGKTGNCQCAVSLTLANRVASVPAAFRLYLPESWAADPARREKAGVPKAVRFQTKWEIALALIDHLVEEGVTTAPVLADAAYGDATAFREGLAQRHLTYIVGVGPQLTAWAKGRQPLPPRPKSPGRGRPGTRLRRDEDHRPESVRDLAKGLGPEAWQNIDWADGTKGRLRSRFALLRVRPAHRDYRRTDPRPEEWLLIEWPEGAEEPDHYWLSNGTLGISIQDLVAQAKLRWRIERDFQELKDEIGLDHYEGRGWRGFHHHASLCIATYAFVVAERARLPPPKPSAFFKFQEPAVSVRPRGRPAAPAG